MNLVGTSKIMQYIAAQPEARVGLLPGCTSGRDGNSVQALFKWLSITTLVAGLVL